MQGILEKEHINSSEICLLTFLNCPYKTFGKAYLLNVSLLVERRAPGPEVLGLSRAYTATVFVAVKKEEEEKKQHHPPLLG